MTPTFIPLSDWIRSWPGGWFAPADGSFLDHLSVTDFSWSQSGATVTCAMTVQIDKALTFTLPGLDGVTFTVLGQKGNTIIQAECDIAPTFAVRLDNLDVTATVSRDLLIPVTNDPPNPDWKQIDNTQVVLTFGVGTLIVDGSGNVTFKARPSFTCPRAMIRDTGIVIDQATAELYLAANEPPPAGQSPGFRGIALSTVTLHLPPSIALGESALKTIVADGVAIGNNGVSGRFSGAWSGELATGNDIGGLAFAPKNLALTIAQNNIVDGALRGSLTLPWFDQPVDASVAFGAHGRLAVSIAEGTGGLAAIGGDGIGAFTLSSLGIELAGNDASVVIGGTLALSYGAPDVTWPSIELQGLRIDKGGNVSLPGGWCTLARPVSMDLHGFRLSVTQVGFGTDDGRKWIGLSGDVRLSDNLAGSASVEGLRLSFASGWKDPALSLRGVGLDLEIPDVLRVTGHVSLTTDANGAHIFDGAATVRLTSLDVAIDARVRIAHDVALGVNTLQLFLDVELPAGLPIGATGAAIFGMSGLVATNRAPRRAGDQSWYAWYAAKPAFDLVDTGKWTDTAGAFAIGAGVSFGTFPDGGYAVSGKGLLVVLVPGPTVLIDAKANVLAPKPPLKGADEGALHALAVIDKRAGTFQLGIDAQWKRPKLLDAAGHADAFFDFHDPAKFHLWLGQQTPATARVHANLLSIASGDAYLMLSSSQVATGASAHFGQKWSLGVVSATLKASIDANAVVSWRPQQASGSLALDGTFAVGVAGFNVGAAATASLTAEAPAPYHVHGAIGLKVDLPWPLDDLDEHVSFDWQDPTPPALTEALASVTLVASTSQTAWPPVADPVDRDARPLLTFTNNVNVVAPISIANPGATATQRDTVGPYALQYDVTAITLERFQGSAWVDAGLPLWGSWAALADGTTPQRRALQLWHIAPFAFARAASPDYAAWYQGTLPDWATGPAQTPVNDVCVDWPLTDLHATGLLVQRAGDLTGLRTREPDALWIELPKPAEHVALTFTTGTARATVTAWFTDGSSRAMAVAPTSGAPVTFSGGPIERISIIGGASRLHRLCRLSIDDADRGRRQAQAPLLSGAAVDAWRAPSPLFEPDSRYRLTVVTTTSLLLDGRIVDSKPFTTAHEFATGHAEAMTPYVGSSRPADGAVAVFRGDDLVVRAKARYLPDLVGGASAAISCRLRDANGVTTTIAGAWSDSPQSAMFEDERSFLGAARVTNGPTDPVLPELRFAVSPTTALKPETVYIAEIVDGNGLVLHTWSFTTSAYLGVADAIGDVGARTTIVAVQSAARPQWTAARRNPGASFESLATTLGIGTAVRPTHARLTVFTARGAVVGVLLDAPQPLPWSDMSAVVGAATSARACRIVANRDATRALLLPSSVRLAGDVALVISRTSGTGADLPSAMRNGAPANQTVRVSLSAPV